MKTTIYVAGKVRGKKWDVIPKHPMIEYVSSDGYKHSEHLWAVGIQYQGSEDTRREVHGRCIDVIKASNALFAYLDTPDSFGSIAEIAYASALGIPSLVVVNMSFEADSDRTEREQWKPEDHDGYPYEKPIYTPMDDAYWFVRNFPLVFSISVYSPEEAAKWLSMNYQQFIMESPIEKSLWFALARVANGLKPVPQFDLGSYRLDFAWPDQCIAVEVDGHDYHKTKEQRGRDAKRDRDLLKMGWTTLRYTGSEIYADPDAVAKDIMSIVAPEAE